MIVGPREFRFIARAPFVKMVRLDDPWMDMCTECNNFVSDPWVSLCGWCIEADGLK